VEPIRPGTLVRDADGFYALVLCTYANGVLELIIGNGLRTLASAHTVTPLGLRMGDPANPPALFQDILDPKILP
jgi:hypothetical protein